MSIRILIADDHDVVRKGLAALIKEHPGWEVCSEASNGREAVKKAWALHPDIVVLDISMPNMNGLIATQKIHAVLPGTEILIVTQYQSEELETSVLRSGARGYILKSDAADELIDAIDALSHHTPFFTRRLSERLLKNHLEKSGKERSEETSLTVREREVVQLLAEGKSNKEVATILELSVKTVETHRANIIRKLSLHSLSELVLYAVRNHITEA